MTRKNSIKQKPYWNMTARELKAATQEFDREFAGDTFQPLTASDRKRWNQAKRGRGRPRIGNGAKVISLSVESDLLSQSDKLARKLKFTRSRLVSEGLKAMLRLEARRRAG